MTCSLFFTASWPVGDSTRRDRESRPFTVDAVLAVLRALVLLTVHGLSRLADRTSLRISLGSMLAARPASARERASQPETTWTITREARTNFFRAAACARMRSRLTTHLLQCRRTALAESPRRVFVPDTDETRDFDQREPAGDAGRHHRGRPAR